MFWRPVAVIVTWEHSRRPSSTQADLAGLLLTLTNCSPASMSRSRYRRRLLTSGPASGGYACTRWSVARVSVSSPIVTLSAKTCTSAPMLYCPSITTPAGFPDADRTVTPGLLTRSRFE
ncbi:MAG: hypothetical protein ACT4PI_14485 [Actinomycetota bacterium]